MTIEIIQGRWVVNTHGHMKRGSIPVIDTDDGWKTPDGKYVDAIECDAQYDRTEGTEVVLQWGEDDKNAIFLPDTGELERIGMDFIPLSR